MPTALPAHGSVGDVLPVPLALRGLVPADLVGVVMRTLDDGPAADDLRLACAMYVLLVRRLLRGERRAAGVLRGARDDLRAVQAGRGRLGAARARPPVASAALEAFLDRPRGAAGGPVVEGFWSGWEAFARSSGFEDPVARAGASGGSGPAAATVGGLAGVCWGSSAVPVELARCRVTGIGEALAVHRVDLVRLPIKDPPIPRDGLAFRATVTALLGRVRAPVTPAGRRSA